MSRRVTETEALGELRSVGYEPTEPFPGSEAAWNVRCLSCGEPFVVRLKSIRAGRKPRHECLPVRPDEALASLSYTPSEPYPGKTKPWKVTCDLCGESFTVKFSAVVDGRRRRHGCTTRSLRIAEDEARSLLVKHRMKPLEDFPGADVRWRVACLECGHELQVRYSQLKRLKNGCKYCAGKAVDPDEAVKVMETAGFRPLEDYPGSHVPWRAACLNCGLESSPRYSLVRSRGSRCKYCARRALPEGEPERQMRERGLEPLEPYPGLHVNWRAKCVTCGTVVQPHFATVRHRGSGCWKCNGTREVEYGVPRAVWTHDEAAAVMEEAGLVPLETYPGATKPWRSRCMRCAREVSPRFAGVRHGKRCRYCDGRNAVHIDTVEAVLAAAGLEALEPYTSALTKWRLRCTRCGTEFRKKYNAVQQGGACPACADRGLDWGGPCLIYLITHERLGAHKVGISGLATDRLRRHGRDGWSVYKTMRVESGFRAYEIEQDVLRYLRLELGLPAFLSEVEMPQSGWTETFDADALALPDAWQLVLDFAQD
jgi:hypothetical protein